MYLCVQMNSKLLIAFPARYFRCCNLNFFRTAMDCNNHMVEASSTEATISHVDDLNDIDISHLLEEPSRNESSSIKDATNVFKYYDFTIDSLLNSSIPNTTVTSSLQDMIQITLDSAFSDWRGSLMFNSRLEDENIFKDHDIIHFVGKATSIPTPKKVYFCPNKYPPENDFKCKGFKLLMSDLQVAAIKTGGYEITGTGTFRHKSNKKGCYRLSCYRCQTYRGDRNSRSNLSYRKSSFNNDRNNNRPKQGKSLPRKTRTKKALSSSLRCPFHIAIHFDSLGFYVLPKRGNPVHKHHPRTVGSNQLIPARLMPHDAHEIMKDLVNADASLGVMRNVLHSKTGQLFKTASLFHIRDICCTVSRLESSPRHFNSTERMIHFLEDNKYEYMMLLHCPQMNSIIHQSMSFPFNDGSTSSVCLPENEHSDAVSFVTSRRASLSVTEQQQFMMAFAWTIPEEKNIFELFPTVLYVDTTCDTNNEGRPLLSINGKDTSSRTFTLVRVFLPNQQMWIFRWVFCILLPKMYGRRILSQIQVIITDGDSQETAQVDNAIDIFFPQAKRVRCGWHIVNRGWNKYVEGPKSFPNSMQSEYDKLKKVVFEWLYSFMRPGYCETVHEYKVSKYLFLQFLGDPELSKGLGTILITNILSWFKRHVEVHEQQFCFYLRTGLLHFGVYSNTPNEGLHNGMKSNSAPVTPMHSIHRTLTILTKNAVRKEQRRNLDRENEYLSSRTYVKETHYDELIDIGKESLQNAFSDSSKYLCLKLTETEFLVIRDHGKYPYVTHDLIPRFNRLRRISYNAGKLFCNCTRRKVWKHICAHVICVARFCQPTFIPDHRSISCIWWKSYYQAGLPALHYNDSEGNLPQLFQLLKQKEAIGVTMPLELVKNIPIHQGPVPHCFRIDLRNPKCFNYPDNLTRMHNIENIPANMTQMSNITNEEICSELDSNSDNNHFPDELNITELQNCNEDVNKVFSNFWNSDIIQNDENDAIKNPFRFLKMSFYEMTETMKGNLSMEEMMDIKSYLDSVTHEMTKRHHEKRNGNNVPPNGSIVSSNTGFKKKFRSHGCSGYNN